MKRSGGKKDLVKNEKFGFSRAGNKKFFWREEIYNDKDRALFLRPFENILTQCLEMTIAVNPLSQICETLRSRWGASIYDVHTEGWG